MSSVWLSLKNALCVLENAVVLLFIQGIALVMKVLNLTRAAAR